MQRACFHATQCFTDSSTQSYDWHSQSDYMHELDQANSSLHPTYCLVMLGHQFKLFTNTFERELAFQKLKQQQGSFYVFHGSPFMKWHSILRTCLQTFSNTPFMSCGAASGPGVYTASCVCYLRCCPATHCLVCASVPCAAVILPPCITLPCVHAPCAAVMCCSAVHSLMCTLPYWCCAAVC